MLPFSSTSMAPWAWKKAPAVSIESVVPPRPMPNGLPPLWQASAAFRNVSSVQLSALGAPPAGYMACTSMPASDFIRSMREQGPLIWLPTVAGTTRQAPLTLPRYSTVSLTLPCSLMRSAMMSSTGSSCSACACGSQVGKARMS